MVFGIGGGGQISVFKYWFKDFSLTNLFYEYSNLYDRNHKYQFTIWFFYFEFTRGVWSRKTGIKTRYKTGIKSLLLDILGNSNSEIFYTGISELFPKIAVKIQK